MITYLIVWRGWRQNLHWPATLLFRVTQKASLVHPEDGYRGENANPGDWIMIGNHDTAPLRAVIERWTSNETIADRATYLATRLEPTPSRRRRLGKNTFMDC